MLGDYSLIGAAADVALAALLLLALINGKKRGLLYTALWVAAIGVAVFGARVLGNYLTEPITERVLPRVEEKMVEAVQRFTKGADSIDWDRFDFSEGREESLTDEEYEELMKSEGFAKVAEQMKKWNMSEEKLKKNGYTLVKAIHDSGEKASSFTTGWAKQTAGTLVKKTVQVVIILVGFVLLLCLLRLLVGLISKGIDAIPLIGTLNKLLGAVLGLAACAILLLIILFVWQHVHPSSFERIREGSYLFAWAAKWNPLNGFFN